MKRWAEKKGQRNKWDKEINKMKVSIFRGVEAHMTQVSLNSRPITLCHWWEYQMEDPNCDVF